MGRVFLALLCVALPVLGGKPGPRDGGLRWAPTWEAAVEEARARNVPIVVHRHGFY